MILSVPITMTLKIALESSEDTRWIAVMLGIDTVLALICWRLFATGYKLKA